MSKRKKFLHRKVKLQVHKSTSHLKHIPYHIWLSLPYLFTALVLVFASFFVYQTRFISYISQLQEPESVSPLWLFPISKRLPPPLTTARNIFIIDLISQTVLFEKNADQPVYPASTTKMLTALVAVDYFPLQQVIAVKHRFPEGSHLDFKIGDHITVEQLLYALLIQSANDAAEILAENFPGGRSAFIDAMNAKVVSLGLNHTVFKNPTGLDEPGHLSSAADLARIAQAAITHPELARIVASETAVITSSDYSSAYILTNVNELLASVPGVRGIKTGYTDLAGQSLVTLVERQSHPVLITLLGSTDRFGETKSLIDWVYANFNWELLSAGTLNQLPTHTP